MPVSHPINLNQLFINYCYYYYSLAVTAVYQLICNISEPLEAYALIGNILLPIRKCDICFGSFKMK